MGAGQTATPGFYPIEVDQKKIFLVDCPGLNDNDKSRELGNQTAIQYILKKCKSLKLCVVISVENIDSSRG